jgi:glycine dehydrogenase subunit 2
MIEPTETESKSDLDFFVDTLNKIADEDTEIVKTAPNNTAVKRVDDLQAVKNPILTWKMI